MISNAVKELQATKKQYIEQIKGLEVQVQKIDSALAALNGTAVSSAAPAPASGKRKMSAAGRKAIAAAAKARWAKHNAQKAEQAPSGVAKPVQKKRTMSTVARKAISLAVKARWAKQKAAAKK